MTDAMAHDNSSERQRYQQLFHADGDRTDDSHASVEELRTTPLLTLGVKDHVEGTSPNVFPQYGVLGFHVGEDESIASGEPILMNTNAPLSAFICGSQGAGKSFTLAAMLENCLLRNEKIGKLEAPLAALVFHYDNDGGSNSLAEVVHLASSVKINILVSRSSYFRLKAAYESKVDAAHRHNIDVQPLLFQDDQLTIDRMHKLMSFSAAEGTVPLYMSVMQQILRDMAVANRPFRFKDFEQALEESGFESKQNQMLDLRMMLLKSFSTSGSRMLDAARQPSRPPLHPKRPTAAGKVDRSNTSLSCGTDERAPIPATDVLTLAPGTLTLIDLSDPFVDASTACQLFEICLSIAKARAAAAGFVVTLDEAHKYLQQTSAAASFVEAILSTVRLQRHKAARVIVATQEPTISDALLDLCSVTIVHRFTSPAWFASLREHVGGASAMTRTEGERREMFARIVALRVGESLVFSPSAVVRMGEGGGRGVVPGRLGAAWVKMKTRLRVTRDGGRSEMSVRVGEEGQED
ncbi:AAA-like domain [Teratosphaeria destructans]|uniref:AAA-like domain n=1 Tax=Teratosphaeria destructans TaxID=418781 RepID=A0A9W7W4Y9_9PEZI|nr:AAA-like domain [Teratosphaeria destructans]